MCQVDRPGLNLSQIWPEHLPGNRFWSKLENVICRTGHAKNPLKLKKPQETSSLILRSRVFGMLRVLKSQRIQIL